MSEQLYLLCRVGDSRIGIPANAIEAVAPVADLVPVPHSSAVIRGVAAIRSRLLTVLDTARLTGAPALPDDGAGLMIVTSIDGHGYGLLVGEVDDVVSLRSLRETPSHLSKSWRDIAPTMADFRAHTVMVVEPALVVAAAQAVASIAA